MEDTWQGGARRETGDAERKETKKYATIDCLNTGWAGGRARTGGRERWAGGGGRESAEMNNRNGGGGGGGGGVRKTKDTRQTD